MKNYEYSPRKMQFLMSMSRRSHILFLTFASFDPVSILPSCNFMKGNKNSEGCLLLCLLNASALFPRFAKLRFFIQQANADSLLKTNQNGLNTVSFTPAFGSGMLSGHMESMGLKGRVDWSGRMWMTLE